MALYLNLNNYRERKVSWFGEPEHGSVSKSK